ncbi:MAG: TonB-dependent receptor [Campylobacterota bacterium]|nr:TonB-dependent receptor [Campylobacterota bacterium]
MRILGTVLTLPVLLFSSSFESTLQEEQLWLQEETFVISASKFKEDIKKTPASVSVIDAEMIERMGAQTLLEALRGVPGIGVHQSNIFVNEIESRGVKSWFSEKVLILLDGHSLNALRNGGGTLQYDKIPLDNVKRIEVVRGPASALYGENAFTALINIITKDAKDIDGIEASIKGGSFNTKTFNLLFGKTYGDLSVSANVNVMQTDGYDPSITTDAVGNSGIADTSSKRKNIHFKMDYQGFYLMGHYSDREEGPFFGIANALNQDTLFNHEAFFVEAGYKKEILMDLTLHLRTYYDKNTPNNIMQVFPAGFPAPVYPNGILAHSSWESTKEGVELVGTYKGDNFVFVSGMMFEKQKIDKPQETQNYDPLTMAPYDAMTLLAPELRSIRAVDRDVYAFYGELMYELSDTLKVSLGGRYDHFSEFGGTINPRMGIVWEANANNIFKAMYGEAFRAPTFAELYNQNNPSLIGNPELDPEKIKTLELGWQNSSLDRAEFKITLFHNEITDIISLGSENMYANEGSLEVAGVEAEVKYNLGKGSYILANYTYQEPQNDYDKTLGSGISKHKAYLGLNYRFNENYNLFVDANYRSEQIRVSSDTKEPIESSIIANATLLVKDLIDDDLTMKFSINNLFDEKAYHTSTVADYPLPERSFLVELKYKF